MSFKSDAQLHKHTLWLRQGDMAFLKEHFPRLGASAVVRKIVSEFVDRLDLKVPDDLIQSITADEEMQTND